MVSACLLNKLLRYRNRHLFQLCCICSVERRDYREDRIGGPTLPSLPHYGKVKLVFLTHEPPNYPGDKRAIFIPPNHVDRRQHTHKATAWSHTRRHPFPPPLPNFIFFLSLPRPFPVIHYTISGHLVPLGKTPNRPTFLFFDSKYFIFNNVLHRNRNGDIGQFD